MNYIKMAPIQGLAGMGGGALSLGIAGAAAAAGGGAFVNGGNRCVIYGGNFGGNTNTMEYVAIDTQGNSADFGDLTAGGGIRNADGCSDSSRGINMGGRDNSNSWKKIEYWTFSTTGNASSFGDMTGGKGYNCQQSNGTRGISAGGLTYSGSQTNVIEYITIQSTGNGTDFGDLTLSRRGCGATANATQMLIGGGYDGSSRVNNIDTITMDTTANATDFGDLTNDAAWSKAGIPETAIDRGMFVGGNNASGTYVDHIEYVSFGSNANTSDFGNLTQARQHLTASSNNTRGIACGGYNPAVNNTGLDTLDYWVIETTSNASDFGNLSYEAYGQGCASGD